jgi:hypothetical protein
MLGAFGVIDMANPFLLDLAFMAEQVFDTEKIAFDVVDRARSLAPFVSPFVAGVAHKQQGYETRDFLPAYVKMKHVVDSTRPLKRMVGERLLGAMTAQERYVRILAELMATQDDEIKRREEWMAAQILTTGGVTVSGEGYQSVNVSFGRLSSHTINLTGASAWGQSGVSALANLETWNGMVTTDSGFNANVVIMDPTAAALFTQDSNVRQVLDNRVNTPNPGFRIGNIQLANVLAGAVGEEVKYLGYIGEFHIFVYQQTYTDAAGVAQPMLPPGTVILLSPKGIQGTRCYGAIQDAEAGFRALPRFPKMWREHDPSVTHLMTQSAPLVVMAYPNASLSANVLF